MHFAHCVRRTVSACLFSSFSVLVLMTALLSSCKVFAQSSDTAGLEVYVHDPYGALLPGAKLHLEQQQQKITRDGTSDKNGHYRFTEVPVGDYVLTVTKDGFSNLVQSGLSLTVSQSATLQVTMHVASADTQVNVIAETPIIDLDRSAIGQIISTEEIENLPSDNRSFLDFALIVPGITANASGGQGSGFSANGGRQRSNSILVDGVENNGMLNGTVRQTISIDAVKAFDVLTNQFLPEYGQAAGAVINVVTKSGSQQSHGDVYYYTRNPALNAQGYCFDAAHQSCSGKNVTRNDFGATLGGPLYKGKTFYFASGEYLGQSLTQSSTISAASVTAVNSALAAGFVPGTDVTSISNAGVYSSNPLTLASVRIDHTMNDRNTFMYRLLYSHYNNANPTINRDNGTRSDYSNYGKDVMQAYSMMGAWTHIFTPSLLNEAHFQFAPQHLTQRANSAGTTVHISSSVEFGPQPLFPNVLDETHYEWIDSLSWTHGSHFVKAGVDISYIRAHTSMPNYINGYWHFGNRGSATIWNGSGSCGANPTNSTFGCGFPDQYHQAFGNPDLHFPDKLLAFYLEDQWKVTPHFSLNYGIRYDMDLQPQGYNEDLSDPIQAPLPKAIPRDYNNIAPRIGFAWSLNKSGNTVVRGGYGIFYDRIFLLLTRNALLARVTLDNFTPVNTGTQMKALWAAGPYPHTYNFPTTLVIPAQPSIASIDPQLRIPLTHQATLFLDQALTRNWELEIGGLFVSGQKLVRGNNTNLAPPVFLTQANQQALGFAAPGAGGFQPTAQMYGRPFYQGIHLNPAFNNINSLSSRGHSTYSALRNSLVHRTSHGLTLRANYVWSKTISDSDDYSAHPTDPYQTQLEKGLSTQDQRNQFTGSAVYRFPYAMHRRKNSPMRWIFGSWTASSIIFIHSGTPENPITDDDSNGDGNTNDRPYINGFDGTNGGIIAGRNSLRGPRSETVQFRMQKTFMLPTRARFIFSAEAFNLLNHVNFTDSNSAWGSSLTPSSSYGRFDAAATPRSIQLGLKYVF